MYYYGNANRSYGEKENTWHLHNANYHQMVSALTQVVRSISPLRIEAPEWHPKVVVGDVDEDKGTFKKVSNETVRNEWITVTRGPSNGSHRKHGNDNEKNYYEVLTSDKDEDDEDDEEISNVEYRNQKDLVLSDDDDDDELENYVDDEVYDEGKNKTCVLALPRREILFHNLREKENLLDEKDKITHHITEETNHLKKEMEKSERLLSSIEQEKADLSNKVNKLESERH